MTTGSLGPSWPGPCSLLLSRIVVVLLLFPNPHAPAGWVSVASIPMPGFGFIDPGMCTAAMATQFSSQGFPVAAGDKSPHGRDPAQPHPLLSRGHPCAGSEPQTPHKPIPWAAPIQIGTKRCLWMGSRAGCCDPCFGCEERHCW